MAPAISPHGDEVDAFVKCIWATNNKDLLINGIHDLANRGDLADRAIVLSLPPLPEHARRTESELFASFERVRPGILGALLDAVVTAMRRLPSTQLSTLPRMADFALWATAAEPSLGLSPGAFMAAYMGNAEARVESVIEASAIGAPLVGLMYARKRWEGTAAELLAELSAERHSDEATRCRRDWPRTPRALSGRLRRLAPGLRQLGNEISFDRAAGSGRRRIVIEDRGAPTVTTVTPSHNPSGAAENGDSGVTVGVTVADRDVVDRHTDRHANNPPGAIENGDRDGRKRAVSGDHQMLAATEGGPQTWEVEV